MKLKNILLSGLSLVLVAALAIGGTVAYLQDDDSDVNVMTFGNVSIEQHEYERVVDANGNYATDTINDQTSYVLKDFTQGKPLLPIVGDPSTGAAGWDNTVVRMTQVDSYGSMQVFAGKNAQDKFVTVENTGKTDAYVRTLVAIEIGSTDGSLIGTSYHSTWNPTEIGEITIDGNTYLLIEYAYKGGKLTDGTWRHQNGILPAGDTSYPNLSQVYIKSVATNEDMEKIDGNGNGTLDILVVSQAVQTAGFADAKTALDTAFGKSSEKAAEWFGGTSIPTTVSSAAELTAALAAGENVVLADDITTTADASSGYGKTGVVVNASDVLDGAGNTYTVTDANTTWDCVIAAKGGTIKNLTVAEGFRGIFMPGANGDLYIDNVVFQNVVYTFNSDAGSRDYGVYISNSTLNGWTSYSNVHKEVVFTNCEFGEGSGYAFLRAYNNTEFVNCNFSAGFEVQVKSGAVANFENCYYNGTLITADNIATLGLLYETDASLVTVK